MGKELKRKIASLNGNFQALFGGPLEVRVTQLSLSRQLEEYDVNVCVDHVPSGEPERESLVLQRIRSCAGHVVTKFQA